jgi:hypothetical protein
MLSAAIARDIYDSLKTKPFFLLKDWHSEIEIERRNDLPICVIQYTEARRYYYAPAQ